MANRPKKIQSRDERRAREAELSQGRLSVAEAVRALRALLGVSQVEFARRVGVAPRVVIDLERGVGNPKLASLQKMLDPWGLQVSVGFASGIAGWYSPDERAAEKQAARERDALALAEGRESPAEQQARNAFLRGDQVKVVRQPVVKARDAKRA